MEGAMVSLVSVGQYTGLRRFFGNPMVGIIGAVASVVTLLNHIVMAECHSLSVSWNKATAEQSRSSTPEFETSRRK
jgi:hypothetical protein